ncbi:ATP-binding cassette domain-containing protein [Streptomyces anulatus]
MHLQLDAVSYTYGRRTPRILDNLTHTISDGFTVLLGPNGAGKSTLLKLAAGVNQPDAGTVRLGDVSSGQAAYRASVAWMPQTITTMTGLTAREQVAYTGWLKGMSRSKAWEAAADAPLRVELTPHVDTKTRRLSGGQVRRVGVASALVHGAGVLLMDEPTAGMDPTQRRRFRNLILRIVEDGVPALISTHDVTDLAEEADQVTVLAHGAATFNGPTDAFLELISTYPGNRWLVTSRPSAVREHWLSGDGFVEADLAPMSRDNIADLMIRWHQAAGISDQYAHELLRAVRVKQDLGRLATNPLMCGLICALHQDRHGYLPEGRKEIYDAALSILLFRRDRERGVYKPGSIRIGEAHHIQLIQKLAYWMIRNGRSEMDRADAVNLLTQALPTMPKVAEQGTAEEIYRHLLIRSGLLREPSVQSMDFIHRTFQDYLGAKAAVEGLDFDFLIANAHLDQWEDVIRMAVAHSRLTERTRLLTGTIRRDNVTAHGMNRLHLLAAACLEHATELDPEVRAEVQQRASALIPPRTADQARALIEVGPVVLDLLPHAPATPPREKRPADERVVDKRSDEQKAAQEQAANEAYFTVFAATRIATDAAIDVLARYRGYHDLRVRNELVRAWSRFDTNIYGREVIAHLGQDDLCFPVSNPAELQAISSFGGRAWIKIAGDFTAVDFLNGCRKAPLTHLWLTSDIGDSWKWLREFPHLRSLTIETSLPHLDVAPLASVLPLRTITLPQGVVVSGMDSLPSYMEVIRMRHEAE